MEERLLTDDVVTLRPWTEDDVDVIVECLDGDPEVSRWLDRVPQPYTRDDALAYVRGEIPPGVHDTFAITDAASGRVLGSIGASPTQDGTREIGYWVRADARGRGVTPRAVRLVVAWVFESNDVVRLQLRADPENRASCRVAEKCGFTLEGILRRAHWNPHIGAQRDWAIYSLLREEV
jgi:RimJ/RimL family protein N-acetyltransferase